MSSGLDKLTNNLERGQFENMKTHSKNFELCLRKGVFPYDWFDCLEKLTEKQLPPKEGFFSKLIDSEIPDEDYEHAQKVRKQFEMKSFREYHDLYLKIDVLLLADVFENFRDICMNNYDLDAAWCYTAPGLAWDACLKKTGVQLELLSDPDMLLMFEQGIRGRVSMIRNDTPRRTINIWVRNQNPSNLLTLTISVVGR